MVLNLYKMEEKMPDLSTFKNFTGEKTFMKIYSQTLHFYFQTNVVLLKTVYRFFLLELSVYIHCKKLIESLVQ